MFERFHLKFAIAGFGLLSLSVASAAQLEADPLFGSAGHDQTIQLTMFDNSVDGEATKVRAGETVRFVVTNRSSRDHGFAVSELDNVPTTAPDTSVGEADSGGHNHQLPESADAASPLVKQIEDSPSVDIPAGVTRELLVEFPRPGQFRFTCPREDHEDTEISGFFNVLPTDASS